MKSDHSLQNRVRKLNLSLKLADLSKNTGDLRLEMGDVDGNTTDVQRGR